jgi:hypothetical protein
LNFYDTLFGATLEIDTKLVDSGSHIGLSLSLIRTGNLSSRHVRLHACTFLKKHHLHQCGHLSITGLHGNDSLQDKLFPFPITPVFKHPWRKIFEINKITLLCNCKSMQRSSCKQYSTHIHGDLYSFAKRFYSPYWSTAKGWIYVEQKHALDTWTRDPLWNAHVHGSSRNENRESSEGSRETTDE